MNLSIILTIATILRISVSTPPPQNPSQKMICLHKILDLQNPTPRISNNKKPNSPKTPSQVDSAAPAPTRRLSLNNSFTENSSNQFHDSLAEKILRKAIITLSQDAKTKCETIIKILVKQNPKIVVYYPFLITTNFLPFLQRAILDAYSSYPDPAKYPYRFQKVFNESLGGKILQTKQKIEDFVSESQ